MVFSIPIDPGKRKQLVDDIYTSIDSMAGIVDRVDKQLGSVGMQEVDRIAPSTTRNLLSLKNAIDRFRSTREKAIGMKDDPFLITPPPVKPDPLETLQTMHVLHGTSITRAFNIISPHAESIGKKIVADAGKFMKYFEPLSVPFPGRFRSTDPVNWPPKSHPIPTSVVELVMDGFDGIATAHENHLDAFTRRERITRAAMKNSRWKFDGSTIPWYLRTFAMEAGVTTIYPGREDLGNLLVDAFPVESGKSACAMISASKGFSVNVPDMLNSQKNSQFVTLSPEKTIRVFNRLSTMPMDSNNQREALACTWSAMGKIPRKSKTFSIAKESMNDAPEIMLDTITRIKEGLASKKWTAKNVEQVVKNIWGDFGFLHPV